MYAHFPDNEELRDMWESLIFSVRTSCGCPNGSAVKNDSERAQILQRVMVAYDEMFPPSRVMVRPQAPPTPPPTANQQEYVVVPTGRRARRNERRRQAQGNDAPPTPPQPTIVPPHPLRCRAHDYAQVMDLLCAAVCIPRS